MDEKALAGVVVKAIVYCVENYGVYSDSEHGQVLVLITDIREERIGDMSELFAIGQEVSIRIERYVPECGYFKGTMKGVSQDSP